MTTTERRALEAIDKYGPQFNGSLAVHADVVWNSRVFHRMERKGWISGYPYDLTKAGRAALAEALQ